MLGFSEASISQVDEMPFSLYQPSYLEDESRFIWAYSRIRHPCMLVALREGAKVAGPQGPLRHLLMAAKMSPGWRIGAPAT